MTQIIKAATVSMLLTFASATVHAQTNILQTLSVALAVYTQGDELIHGNPPLTNNTIDKAAFLTRALIKAVSASGTFHDGDLLVRATPVTNNAEGIATWEIYNTLNKSLVPISTNVYFEVHTAHVYTETNVPAYLHGETVRDNGRLAVGTTDEIRSLVLSNSTTQIRLQGYAHGHVVPVSLTSEPSTNTVYSRNYFWEGNGSGIISNQTVILDGTISEDFRKLQK